MARWSLKFFAVVDLNPLDNLTKLSFYPSELTCLNAVARRFKLCHCQKLVVRGPRRNQPFFFLLWHAQSTVWAPSWPKKVCLYSKVIVWFLRRIFYAIWFFLAWLDFAWSGVRWLIPICAMHFSHAQYQNFIRINSLDFSVHLFISFSLIKLKSNNLASYSQSCHYNWIKKKKSQSHWHLQQW